MDTQFRPAKEKQHLWLWISSLIRRRFFEWSRCIHPPPPRTSLPLMADGNLSFFLYGLSIKWPAYNCYVHETCKTSFPPHCLKYAGHFVLAPHKENLISLLMGCKGKGFKTKSGELRVMWRVWNELIYEHRNVSGKHNSSTNSHEAFIRKTT